MTAMISHSINEKDQADTAIANAALIAAAPEMLAVLEMFIKNWRGSDVDWFTQCYEIERLAESAITKAKGGSVNHFPDAAKMVAQEGWQMVPMEPTIEMVQAATNSAVGFGTRAAYQAMLSAAPKPEWGAA